ncbi:Uncharacterised protein [Legionella wadsworthii]|uniref:Uncharacterized protein n=1 Tax=Legionella wadsworthii TaxID=28088 RepID=A0A378M2X7_9GAMM|nr:Uncharacterised protein [Legionella wadsworthii]
MDTHEALELELKAIRQFLLLLSISGRTGQMIYNLNKILQKEQDKR